LEAERQVIAAIPPIGLARRACSNRQDSVKRYGHRVQPPQLRSVLIFFRQYDKMFPLQKIFADKDQENGNSIATFGVKAVVEFLKLLT
jgi:hypothetical protein